MKILYCIPHLYNSGGMERVLTQKINWLAEHTSHTFAIVTTERVPNCMRAIYFSLDERVRVDHFSIDFNADYSKPLPLKWYGHMRRMSLYERRLKEYIQAEGIDLCISMGGKEVAFLRNLPCRTIVEMHFSKDQRTQLLTANHRGIFWSLVGRIRTWQLIRDVRGLERIVVLTERDKADWLKEGCRNVTVIPNPCVFDGMGIEKLPNISDKKIILAVGRLHEQKGFDMLLRAWEKVQKDEVQSTRDWTLRIVGEGLKRAELEALIRTLELKNVCLVGRVENVAQEYAEASLFVLSSRYEGFSLVLAEAMWSGTPCVSFDCPEGPAELLADGRGWLVPAGDVEKLAEQILYVIAHPDEAQERAAKAQTYAHETYSEEAIMPKWKWIIEN